MMVDSSDKRRNQNRISQRNFRDRRAQKVVELERQLHEQRTDHELQIAKLTEERAMHEEAWQRRLNEIIAHHANEKSLLRAEVTRLEEERDELRRNMGTFIYPYLNRHATAYRHPRICSH